MASRAGRKPTPTALKVLRTGKPGPKAKKEPQPPPPLSLDPPSWMHDRIARRAYREMARRLYNMGVFTSTDTIALEMLCQTYAQWRAITDVDNVEPVMSANGNVYMNQRMATEMGIAKRLSNLLSDFGLTPVSRAKVQITEEGVDPLQDFLKNGTHGGNANDA
jgi:P27 family predicted phage terminase small subunit